MKIDQDKLERWIESRFGVYKHYHGDYLVNSPFKEDNKFKLSISPSKQCYHCWKTDNSGPLWKLVIDTDKCSKQQAFETVYNQDSIDNFDNKIDGLRQKVAEKFKEKKNNSSSSELPESFRYISHSNNGEINLKAIRYVSDERKIDPVKWRMGYCFNGRYQGRLIIPFFDKNDKIIYWIGRSLYNQEPKYLNFNGLNKQDLLFSKDWNFENQDVFVTEGVFDMISLSECGFNAVSIQGAAISENQIKFLIKARNIILAFDKDSAGQTAVEKNTKILKENGLFNLKYIKPVLKDWNEFLIKYGKERMKEYVSNNIQNTDFKFEVNLRLENNAKEKSNFYSMRT
jgi:DNA primase